MLLLPLRRGNIVLHSLSGVVHRDMLQKKKNDLPVEKLANLTQARKSRSASLVLIMFIVGTFWNDGMRMTLCPCGLPLQNPPSQSSNEKAGDGLVTKSCLTLCNPTDCNPPSSPVHGFPGHGYWSGFPFPSAGDLPDPAKKNNRQISVEGYSPNIVLLRLVFLKLSKLSEQRKSEKWL